VKVICLQYFVVTIDYGKRGREAVVDPEITRREVISRMASGEYIHEIADASVEDDTADILNEAALPEVATTGAGLQANDRDHALICQSKRRYSGAIRRLTRADR